MLGCLRSEFLARSLQSLGGKVIILQVFKVLFDSLTGVKRLDESSLASKLLKVRFQLRF